MNVIMCIVPQAVPSAARSLWVLLVLTLLSGCAFAVTVPTEEPDMPFQEEVLGSLLGSTMEEVLERFKPRYPTRLEGGGRAYFIYRGVVDSAGVVVAGLPVPAWGETTVCSMLEFGMDRRLRSYETYRAYVGVPGAHSLAPSKDCREAFWSEDELAEFQRAKEAEIERRAKAGDPEAMYEYAELQWRRATTQQLSSTEKQGLICRSAHGGYSAAQRRMGVFYFYADDAKAQDLVLAHMWFRLAEGEGSYSVSGVAKKMTPAQIAEAERLVAEWEPNPEECEVYSDAANAP